MQRFIAELTSPIERADLRSAGGKVRVTTPIRRWTSFLPAAGFPRRFIPGVRTPGHRPILRDFQRNNPAPRSDLQRPLALSLYASLTRMGKELTLVCD